MIITLQWKESGPYILKEYVTNSGYELLPFIKWEYDYLSPESEVSLPSISLIKDTHNE